MSRGGSFTGGESVIPKFGIQVPCQPGDVVTASIFCSKRDLKR